MKISLSKIEELKILEAVEILDDPKKYFVPVPRILTHFVNFYGLKTNCSFSHLFWSCQPSCTLSKPCLYLFWLEKGYLFQQMWCSLLIWSSFLTMENSILLKCWNCSSETTFSQMLNMLLLSKLFCLQNTLLNFDKMFSSLFERIVGKLCSHYKGMPLIKIFGKWQLCFVCQRVINCEASKNH